MHRSYSAKPAERCAKLIVVYGTVCLDRVRLVDRVPGPGGYAEVRSEALMLGGEAANTACALKAWGADVRLRGNPLGEGDSAALIAELLKRHGLDPEPLQRGVGETPVCDVYVTPDGERTMFGMGFRDIARHAVPDTAAYTPGHWFTADPNFGETSRRAVRTAKDAGMRLYLMDFVGEHDPIFEGSFWQSSTDWAGRKGDVSANMTWLRRWSDRHRASGILTDGPAGFGIALPNGFSSWLPPFPTPKVVDATGAGDMFRAGMVYGLHEDWPLPATLRFAAAAASLKCQALGATGHLPSVREVRALIEREAAIARVYDAVPESA